MEKADRKILLRCNEEIMDHYAENAKLVLTNARRGKDTGFTERGRMYLLKQS